MSRPTLESSLLALAQQYHRICFVVAAHGAGLTATLSELATRIDTPVISLGALFSEALLDLTVSERRLRATRVLADLVDPQRDRVVIDSIEVLFAPTLALDPVAVLSQIARHRTLIVSWPGTWDGQRLSYAEPGHPEHKLYDTNQVMVLPLADLRSLLATSPSEPS